MRMPKKFEEYLKLGIAKKVSPDKHRAAFLINESKNSVEGLKERIEKIEVNSKNANSIIKDCYDIIMELIRAKMLLDGYSCSGQYAHEAEISYLMDLNFSDNDVAFLNELRYFRNGITYYGKILDKIYAEKVILFLKKFYPKLSKIVVKALFEGKKP